MNNFNELDLLRAQKQGIISLETFNKLLEFLKVSVVDDKVQDSSVMHMIQKNKTSKFNIENFLYYFGAFIIISTMGWYLGSVWNNFGHGGLLLISILYFIIFTVIGNFLWNKDKKTPGGLLYVCAVSVIPLLVWAFESLVGIMPRDLNKYNDFHIFVRSGWVLMEIATIFVGFIFLKYRKFPLLTLPICYSLWYLSMDIVPLCLGQTIAPTWGMRNFATFVFALLMLGCALKLDNNRKISEDYSHWLYIFGATMLWGVIISILAQFRWDNEFAYFLTAIFNFAYMFTSIILKRKVFMVWGAIGFWTYLGHLVYQIFKDTPILPLALVVFGLSVIFLGIYYSKNCKKLEDNLSNLTSKLGF